MDEEQILTDLMDRLIEIAETLGDRMPMSMVRELSATMTDIMQRLQEIQEPADIPAGAEFLWSLAQGNPEAFVRYMQTVPNHSLNQIGENPQEMRGLTNSLASRVSFPVGETADGVPHANLQSSNIYGFQYNPQSKKLVVKFQGPGNEGPIYEYDNVSPRIFSLFQTGAIPAKTSGKNQFGQWWVGKNPSLGASFYELIRNGGYPYARVA